METVNIDISGYAKAKEAKSASVVKLNGSVYYTRKVYDRDTGKPEPQIAPLFRAAIENSLAQAQESVETLELLLADYDAAEEKL